MSRPVRACHFTTCPLNCDFTAEVDVSGLFVVAGFSKVQTHLLAISFDIPNEFENRLEMFKR